MLMSENLLTRSTSAIVLLAAYQNSEESTFTSVFAAKYSNFDVEFDALYLRVANLCLCYIPLDTFLNLIYLEICV